MDSKKKKSALTDAEQACLLLIRADMEVASIFSHKVLDKLLQLGLIQLRPNSSRWMLSLAGEGALAKRIAIKYPLYSSDEARDYNSILRSMDEKSTDALICAAMNERSFDKIPKKTARVLGQHLLDISFYHKFGSVLIGKWKDRCEKSLEWFDKMKDKYDEPNKNKHTTVSK